ncbi:MAG: radical SAM protein [Myxococcales bacterium]|nr:radical SAM protein [Myxococcales bacterium]
MYPGRAPSTLSVIAPLVSFAGSPPAPAGPPAAPRGPSLRLIEIYASVQGESTFVGVPCVFIRLAGCNLRCTWCDSTFTFTGGEHREVDAIVEDALSFGIPLVEVTGGEPLVHRSAIPLMQKLVDRGATVLLETSGSRDIGEVPQAVHVILDFKPPDSGEERANLWSNVEKLKTKDEVKFVIGSRRDFEWSRDRVAEHRLDQRVGAVLFSPVWGKVEPKALVQWIVDERLPVRFQLQMHKVVWPQDERGV